MCALQPSQRSVQRPKLLLPRRLQRPRPLRTPLSLLRRTSCLTASSRGRTLRSWLRQPWLEGKLRLLQLQLLAPQALLQPQALL